MKALNQQLNTANRSLLYVMSSYFTVKNANTAVMALTVIGSGANLIGILMLNLQGIIWYIALVYATTGLTYTVTYQKDIQRTYLGILQVLITISIIYVPSDFMSTVALYSQDNSQGFIKLAGLVGYSIGVFGALLLTGTEKDSIIHRQLKQ